MFGKIVFLSAISLCANSAFAQCPPQDFMRSDIEISTSDSTLKWSQMSMISKDKFEELKRNGHLWLSLPKVPLITTIDYDDFKKIVAAERSSQNQDLTLTQTQTMYRSNLSAEATKSYIACLQNQNGYLDISVPPNATDNTDFFVTLTWWGPRGTPNGKFDAIGEHHFQIIGGEIIDETNYDKIDAIKNGQGLRVKVHRDLNKPFSFSASVDGNSNEIGLPAKAPQQSITFKVATSDEQPAYADGLSNQHNGFCLKANDDQIFLQSTKQYVDRRFPGNGKAWTDWAGSPNEKLICATANAEMYGGRHVHGNARIFSRIEVLSIITSK
jgi:hypothetical protein